jgi:nitroimidazol reductase NimA-like FMN-containing flavoprotein (pyridoxamine 5'-phosphate oxidase superfamily)
MTETDSGSSTASPAQRHQGVSDQPGREPLTKKESIAIRGLIPNRSPHRSRRRDLSVETYMNPDGYRDYEENLMEIVKIPNMDKEEYDKLIEEGFISRIAFQGEKYPYIAPFLYVFDGKFLYFLATKYGRKNDLFRQHPYVSVEIEKYSSDLSCYTFVTMQGYLVQVEDAIEKKIIREKFVDMIRAHNLSKNVLAALGHRPDDPIEAIASEERSNIWKLTGVTDIVALKNL